MVFYLKYRPQTLNELDNTDVSAQILRYLSRGSIPHAFLLSGPKGTGKTSTARIIAKSINCKRSKTKGIACGTCEICVSIAKGIHLDILEIDAASNRGIDEMRTLRETIKLSPSELAYKLYIIDEVHMLTTEAFNALLKTLEEPPPHAVFLLATTEIHKIPETIISRCVRIDFKKATIDDIVKSLTRIVTGEKLNTEPAALTAIAHYADGSFRDAAKLLEELSLSDDKITEKSVHTYTGKTDETTKLNFVEALKKKDAANLLRLMQEFDSRGIKVKEFFMEILKLLQTELLAIVESNKTEWNRGDLMRLITVLSRAFTELKTAIIPTLPFELAVVEYCENVTVVEPKTTSLPVASSNKPQIVKTNVKGAVLPLVERWDEFLDALKSYNHSIVGVLRSCQPVSLENNILTFEAAYAFHADRLSDPKVHDTIAKVIKSMLGLDVKIKTVIKTNK